LKIEGLLLKKHKLCMDMAKSSIFNLQSSIFFSNFAADFLKSS